MPTSELSYTFCIPCTYVCALQKSKLKSKPYHKQHCPLELICIHDNFLLFTICRKLQPSVRSAPALARPAAPWTSWRTTSASSASSRRPITTTSTSSLSGTGHLRKAGAGRTSQCPLHCTGKPQTLGLRSQQLVRAVARSREHIQMGLEVC